MDQSIWHIGIAVPDLTVGKHEFGEIFGLRWRPTRVRLLTVTDENGIEHEVECRVTFSEGGPFAIELWEAIPGTPLAAPPGGGVHHVGYWVDDLSAEDTRLAGMGFPHFATVSGGRPLLNHGPSGTVIELCDPHSDRPQLRDLFPPSSEFAGAPILDSQL